MAMASYDPSDITSTAQLFPNQAKLHFFYYLVSGLFRAGVSNSVSYAGHILTKKGSRAALRGKYVSAGHNWRLKMPLYYKKP